MRVGSVIKAASIVYKIRVEDLIGQRRDRMLVEARQAAMYVARRDTRASLPEIARRLGDRDHTTVLHGYRKVAAAIARDPEVQQAMDRIADLARVLDERYGAQMLQACTTSVADLIATAPSEPVGGDLMPAATVAPKDKQIAARSPFKPVSDATLALAKVRLDRYAVGSRVWCEIQNARFFQHIGVPYTPSVRVLKSGGVVHGV